MHTLFVNRFIKYMSVISVEICAMHAHYKHVGHIEESKVTYKEVFDIYVTQANAAGDLWGYYSTVALALLAATVGSDKIRSSKQNVLVVIGAFSLFAIGNLLAILPVQQSVEQFGAVANKLAELSPLIKHIELEPTCVEFVATFHIICDLAFATAVYTITRSHWLESAQQ